ncbi:unnamed protein product [Arabidopsis arenosa]|uniref:F-box domain-containing protein n=1 Tax=Arabidopsis arenosa TaxID=38785 RepID=A0A8S2AME7_ARAAE|nr:unnamed protein product [Arabidopsis arenosa]
MASSSLPPAMEVGEYINWTELPPELTSAILHRLGAIEILENAQKVCRSWRRVCKDPSMWRKIDMHNLGDLEDMDYNLEIMCRHAEIDIWYFGTDGLLNYIAYRSSNLRSLRLTRSSNLKSFALPVCYPSITTIEELVNAIAKFPFLETLEFFDFLFILDLKAIGHACPQLKTLKINFSGYTPCDDDDAIAIAESMPELRHLQLMGNGRLTDTGLNAIRDGCPHLEHLDRRDESPGDHDRHEIVTRASVILMRS